jgi:hypothetical protein
VQQQIAYIGGEFEGLTSGYPVIQFPNLMPERMQARVQGCHRLTSSGFVLPIDYEVHICV